MVLNDPELCLMRKSCQTTVDGCDPWPQCGNNQVVTETTSSQTHSAAHPQIDSSHYATSPSG